MYAKLITLCALLATLVLTGCPGSNEAAADKAPTAIRCDQNADCPKHLDSCQHNLCVDGKGITDPIRVSAHIYPPSDRPELAPLSLSNVDLDTQAPLVVSLDDMVTVNGRLQNAARETVSGIFTLFFTRQDDIAGRRYMATVTTDESGSFSAQLPAGVYSVSISDTQSDLPDASSTLTVDAGNQGRPVYLSAPQPEDFIRWSGRLTRLNAQLETRPIADVTIWASSQEGTSQSTQSTTDENGRFSFYLHRSIDKFRVHVRGKMIADDQSVYLVPSTSTDVFEADLNGSESNLDIPGSEVILGHLQPASLFRGIVLDEQDRPVSNARILAQNRNTLPWDDEIIGATMRSTLEARATTNEEGEFEIYFPPTEEVHLTAFSGEDDILITDPERTLSLYPGSDGPGAPILLRATRGHTIDFEVLSSRELPVENYEARLELVNSDLLSARHFDASIDEFGRAFSMNIHQDARTPRMRRGVWRISITPTLDSNLPMWSTTRQILSEEQKQLTIVLPQGVAGRFQILDPSGEPIRGASVDIFIDFGDSDIRRVGTAQSNSEGNASMVLPFLPTAD